jgi:hypothetical protein
MGARVYTKYSLTLEQGAEAPSHWPRGQNGIFPCHVASGWYNGHEPNIDRCVFTGLHGPFGGEEHVFKTPHWHGAPPGAFVFCGLKSSRWGSVKASAKGVAVALRHPEHQNHRWWAKLEFSHPIWCPGAGSETPTAAAMTYGTVRMTLYGSGEDITPETKSPFPKHRGSPHFASESIHPSYRECWLGTSLSEPEFGY